MSGDHVAKWYEGHFPDEEYHIRCQQVILTGLPCIARCVRNGFVSIELDQLPGWVHVSNDTALEREMAAGWHYHVSICHEDTIDEIAWTRIVKEFDRKELVIKISYFTHGANAMLRWDDGIGALADVWQLFLNGSQGWKFAENAHGLHISM